MRLQRLLRGPRFIRAINYHGTPAALSANLRRQFEYLARRFVGVKPSDLEGLLSTGDWPHNKPGVIITFDDGLRSNYEVAAPLLEEFGLVGWFFVPTAFVDIPPLNQVEYANRHHIRPGLPPPDGRVAMSWSEIRALGARHVVGCHTASHRRLHAKVPPSEIRDEVVEAKRVMEERIGCEVQAFCWVGGEEENFSHETAVVIRDAGFRFAFMSCSGAVGHGTNPLQIHRTNIEGDWPLHLLPFQLGGFMDVFHGPKRRRVNRITKI